MSKIVEALRELVACADASGDVANLGPGYRWYDAIGAAETALAEHDAQPAAEPQQERPAFEPFIRADGTTFIDDLIAEKNAKIDALKAQPQQERNRLDPPRSVADIPDSELLRRVVRSVARNRPRRKEFAWAAVSETFALGSTYSMQLCRRFGLDPDTGAELKTPNAEFSGAARRPPATPG